MLSYKSDKPLPLALWEQVKYGQDIGIDVSKDKICGKCWLRENYSKVVEVNGKWNCPTHGYDISICSEYVIEENPKYRGFYETRLIERLKGKMQTALTTTTPNLVKQDELLRMKAIVRARVGTTDFGNFTEDVINMIAYGALVHGLNPVTGEVFPYVEKNYEGKITKISLEVDYRGLQRSARAQADFHIAEEEIRRLTTEEIRERRLNITPNYDSKTKAQQPFIEHDPKDCIAVEVPIYRLDLYRQLLELAKEAKSLGIKPIPVSATAVGFGIFRPGDSIPKGRSAEWRAETRARKDAIRKAYDLNFIALNFFINPNNPKDVTMTTDDEMPDQPYIEVVNPPDFSFPGTKLDKPQTKYMINKIKNLGYNPESLMLQVFGEGITMDDLTDIAGHNLMELAKRYNAYKEKKLDAQQLGHPELMNDALYAAMEQECLTKSHAGEKWSDLSELLKKVDNESLEQLPK